jgi:Tfp pilus assembly protein PilF
MEARQGQYVKAREIFSRGLQNDPNCAPLYHAAALMEAKIGNLEVKLITH